MGACCSKAAAVQPLDNFDELGLQAADDVTSCPAATASAVKVVVLVRPLLPLEEQQGATSIVSITGPDKVSLKPAGPRDPPIEFKFDRAYLADTPRAGVQLYADMVQPVVERFLQGFNACVLAYGQTGSGKTFSMEGAEPARLAAVGMLPHSPHGGTHGTRQSPGVLALACSQLLHYMAAAAGVYDASLKVSYVEIYNEAIQDLLSPSAVALASPAPAAPGAAQQGGGGAILSALRAVQGGGGGGSSNAPGSPRDSTKGSTRWEAPTPSSPSNSEASFVMGGGSGSGGSSSGISIYETASGQTVLGGVTEVDVSCAADIAALLDRGGAVRATATHRLNQHSSRSHAIFTLTLQQRARNTEAAAAMPPELRMLCSKLHICDLAGSERAKDTGATGQRFAEGVCINKGLLELGNVINALSEADARKPGATGPPRHIPYRNSKLTRLLRDSLGGSSETLFLACVSPADTNRDHTLSTLRYASRAMHISNRLVRATMGAAEELAYLREMVAQLQAENAALKQTLQVGGGTSPTRLGGSVAKAGQQQVGQQGQRGQVSLVVQAC